ncbi:MAG: membrane protein insertase YidC, partial [Pseudomonadota bacterium]
MADNRNMFLAVGLSLAVIIIWQFFFIQPQMEAEREAQQRQAEIAAQQNPGAGPNAVPNAPANPAIPAAPQAGGATGAIPAVPGTPADAASAADTSARITIETPKLTGSIRLVGGRLDDLHLRDYHVTVDPESPTVTLLSPTGTQHPYFVETGWVADGDVPKPDSRTVWTLDGNDRLTPDTPVTLVYDTGAGLIYRRTIEVDEDYLFTVRQQVENNSGAEVTLFPYSRVRRQGTPDISGFFILHEGFIGVFGEDGLYQENYSTLEDETVQQLPRAESGWVGITDKYWATAVIPDPGSSFNSRFLYDGSQGVPAYQADYLAGGVTVADGATGEAVNRVFAGAKKYEIIQGYEDTVGIDRFNLLIDWGWFYFITKPLFLVIDYIHGIVGNFGIAILVTTVLVKL